MIRILFIFMISQFSAFSAMAQIEEEVKSFSLGVSAGGGRMVVRDQVFTTYLYKAGYAPVGFHFNTEKRNQKASVNIEFFNKPKLVTQTNKGLEYKGDLGDFYETELNGYDISTLKSALWNINYTQLFLLTKLKDNKVQKYLGFDLNTTKFEKSFLQFEYISELTDRIYSLGFVLHFKRDFNDRHQLTYNLSLPLISHVKRSLYNPDAEPATTSESKFTILASSLGLDSRFSYRYKLSEKFSLNATYMFRYLQVTFPAKEQWACNQGTVGLFYHF